MSCLNASRGDPPMSVVSGETGPCVGYLPVEYTVCMPIHTKSEAVVVVLVTDVILESARNLSVFESKFEIIERDCHKCKYITARVPYRNKNATFFVILEQVVTDEIVPVIDFS